MIKKTVVLILNISLLISPFFSSFTSPFSLQQVHAEEQSCTAGALNDLQSYISTRVGGISLDQAAVFLADMTDITGAYYDANQDRIVFVGKKNTSAPKFNKDDLAVA